MYTGQEDRTKKNVNMLNYASVLTNTLPRSSLVVQQVKDLTLSLLGCRFNPWPRKCYKLQTWPKKKKFSQKPPEYAEEDSTEVSKIRAN